MVIERAAKAKAMLTCAINTGHYSIKILLLYSTLYGKFATRSRTPLEIIPIVHICSRQEDFVAWLNMSVECLHV